LIRFQQMARIQTSPNSRRGGARAGAGRKPTAALALELLPPREQMAFLVGLYRAARRGNAGAFLSYTARKPQATEATRG